jgi:hypothetical protein
MVPRQHGRIVQEFAIVGGRDCGQLLQVEPNIVELALLGGRAHRLAR